MRTTNSSKSPFIRNGQHSTIYELKRVPPKTNVNDIITEETEFPFITGSNYKGEWQNTMKHGYGTQSLQDGTKYEGEWENDKKHGQGILWKRVGKKLVKKYEGSWKNGGKDGYGTYFYANSEIYSGEWKENRRHGPGRFEIPQNEIYSGSWVNGELCGECKVQYFNGNIFIGNFINGKKNGIGRHFYANTFKVYEGKWVDGEAVCGEYRDPTVEESELLKHSNGNLSRSPVKPINLPKIELAYPDEKKGGRDGEGTPPFITHI